MLTANTPSSRSIRWSGPCSGGLINGEGRLQVLEGEKAILTYDGSVASGAVTGRGTMVFSNGRRVEGGFVNGAPNGRVTMLDPVMGRMEVEMTNGKVNGYGTVTKPDGTRLEARFVNNVPNGPFVYTQNGQRTEGIARGGCLYVGSQVLAWQGSPGNCRP